MSSQQQAAMMPGGGMPMNAMMPDMASMQMPMNMPQMQGPGMSHPMMSDVGAGGYPSMPSLIQQNGQPIMENLPIASHIPESHEPTPVPQRSTSVADHAVAPVYVFH
jgi:hypothetical protein